MKYSLLTFLLSNLSFGSVMAQSQPDVSRKNNSNKKILIVYLSRTNNTKAVAEIIHEQVGGKMVSLELLKPYPANYKATVAQVAHEDETGYLPALKTKIEDINEFDIIFVGFPTWGMQLPPPVRSFLTKYNLSGKTVVPFNTNAGYGIGTTFQTVKELCPHSKLLKGYSTEGGIERDGVLFVMKGNKQVQVQSEVKEWLRRIKMMCVKRSIINY